MPKDRFETKIKNAQGEDLDTLVEGNKDSDSSIIFVHGFGTNKDENYGLFPDIAGSLMKRHRVIRFDLSGYGNSGGRQEDASCGKHAADLEVVIRYARAEYGGRLNILAHSMGAFSVLMLSPDGIRKTVFTSIPNPDTERQLDNLKRKILSRPGGIVNEEGISVYPRTTGEAQRLGPSYWRSLREFDPLSAIKKYSLKTELMVFRPLQDEVIPESGMENYRKIKSFRYIELDGNHNFTRQKDRERLIADIHKFLE
jgi:pimeloyl-ACP methyl ester carboxylesterase